ncbi:diguanylate phosphodiesterase [Alteromonas marina]|jgi:EAL and modified HD-GYP domain-containing signal transduction protein|uniref:Diguanylate phosphodiesterase n=1 Tax=Alteromonas marina TaxID=203795 RepID=A0A0B3XZ85_9ALTE|nr:EAL domain-containing protein [Alteromonas marina]KHT55022.1 diguanylate phosphodiesterase [Alteromonas marina]|tara:strand:+ start:1908 stop:3143 length:1236 start_codon:yes stop_codon:yes gene_type:complete
MFAFIARQPILDKSKSVFAYELLFRDGKSGAYPEHSEEKAKYISEHFHPLGLDDISGEKTSFITFSSDTIISRFPTSLNPESIVVELADPTDNISGLFEACQHIKQLGFKLAIDDPMMVGSKHDIFPLIDIVKVDVTKTRFETIEKHIPRYHDANVQLVAEQVDTQDSFTTCVDLGFDFFQGYFFSQPEVRILKQLPASKMNIVDLMGESSSSNFNIERISQIIERDATLSFLLLKFINNPTINKRYKITSLKHALNYMGEVEIKKFIALLSLTNLGDEKPLEIIHMSLVRAKFFDLLAERRGIKNNPPISFLVGLFSLLEGLLDQSMTDIVKQLPLSDEVNDALLGKNLEMNNYMTLVRAFESALWMNVIKQAKMLDIDQKQLHMLYNQAIIWGNGVRSAISSHYPRAIA